MAQDDVIIKIPRRLGRQLTLNDCNCSCLFEKFPGLDDLYLEQILNMYCDISIIRSGSLDLLEITGQLGFNRKSFVLLGIYIDKMCRGRVGGYTVSEELDKPVVVRFHPGV